MNVLIEEAKKGNFEPINELYKAEVKKYKQRFDEIEEGMRRLMKDEITEIERAQEEAEELQKLLQEIQNEKKYPTITLIKLYINILKSIIGSVK